MSEAIAKPLELWLPDLPRFDASHPIRALLARGDRMEDGAKGYLAGLAGYFTCPNGFSAAALTREMLAGDAADAAWLCADPAWIQPDLNGARLLACGQMQLSMDEAQALARPLKPVFGDAGMILEISSPDRWHLRLPVHSPVPDFAAPEQALGEDLYQHLPQGADGRRWRALLTEVQVLLHQHPLNAERREHGLAPINSLWLWGGGRLPNRVNSALAAVVADDLLLGALAKRANVTVLPRTPASLQQLRAGWLLDLQDLPVDDLTRDWWPRLQPLAAQQPLMFAFASGERWLYRPWHRFRFWRGGTR